VKLLSLDLLAYGPFTEQHLEFDGFGTDFHIILGNNEAGKSSSLRALCALLYGVPERTKDAFLHANTKLLLGGRLRHSDGEDRAFLRRKGRKNTLMDLDRHPIADTSLDRFLVGVDQDRFQSMFGIDHDRLAQGAEEILRGGGNVGQSLFAASIGSTRLRELLKGLDDQTDKLFRPRGSTPAVNQTLARFKDAKRRVRELSKSSREWEKQSQHIESLKADSRALADKKATLDTQIARLQRLKAALPVLARRRDLLNELDALAQVVSLPLDAPDRRRTAENALREAQRTCKQAEQKLVALNDRAGSMELPQPLLEQKAAIDAIYKELGRYRKATQETTEHEARSTQLRADAQDLLDALGRDTPLDDVHELRPRTDTLARVHDLVRRFEALDQAPGRCATDLKRAQGALEEAQRDLAGLDPAQDPAPLRATIHRVRKRGDLEQAHRDAEVALETARSEATTACSALHGWQGTLDQAEALAVPSRDTVDRFAEDFAEHQRAAKARQDALRTGQERLADQDEKLGALRLSGDVPTEAELERARTRRTQGWQQVRKAWQQGQDLGMVVPDFDDEHDLPTAFEGSVAAADEIGDRLRREADRVARYAELEASRSRILGDLDTLKTQGDDATQAQASLAKQWSNLWAPLGVTCLPPREMRPWLDRHEHIVGLAQGVRRAHQQVTVLATDIQRVRDEISAALAGLGHPPLDPSETLDAALDRAQRLLDTIVETARRRQELGPAIQQHRDALKDAQHAAAQAETALAEWRDQWASSMDELGLPPTALPAEATAVLGKLSELFEKLDKADRARTSLKRARADARTFEEQVRAVVELVAPDLVNQPPSYAVETLHQRLAAAEKDATTLSELGQQIDELNDLLRDAKASELEASADLAQLCRQAGCDRADQLEGIERDSQAKCDKITALADLDLSLNEHRGGATIDELEAQAADIDADALPGRIEALRLEIEPCEARRSELDRQIGQEQAEFSRIDGSDDAAAEAGQVQGLLAQMRTDVDRYVRLRLASELLRQEIERYRQANQGPLLKRASQLFSALTLGSFVDLRADLGDKGEPVWIGQRPSGELLGVAGMSDGTIDQLYLSIRLATLERHLAAREPIPFVVDDILIRFDDQRSSAALGVLAELSEHTQVLFFTHHERLAELAQQLGDGRVAVHKLGASADPG